MDIYSDLLSAGWTMNDIDTMDFFGYIEVLAYRANKKTNEDEKLVPINQIPGW